MVPGNTVLRRTTTWSRPGSLMAQCPALSASTLVRFGSTPITSCPNCARHAAETVPTYPRPHTIIRILLCSKWYKSQKQLTGGSNNDDLSMHIICHPIRQPYHTVQQGK